MKLLKSCTLAQVPPSSLPRTKRHEAGGEDDVFYSAAHKLYSITSLTQFGGPTQNKRAWTWAEAFTGSADATGISFISCMQEVRKEGTNGRINGRVTKSAAASLLFGSRVSWNVCAQWIHIKLIGFCSLPFPLLLFRNPNRDPKGAIVTVIIVGICSQQQQ